MATAGVVWRLHKFEQGSLPGLAVGDVVALDYTDREYVISKPGVGRVATMPVSSWQLEKCVCCAQRSGGTIRYETSPGNAPWVTLSNRAERIKVTFDPPPDEALLDPDVQTLIRERSVTPSEV